VRRDVDRWTLLLIGAVVLRLALVAVLAFTQTVAHNGWYFSGNKDQIEYYAMASALVHGAIAPIYTFMGYGTLLAPFVGGTDFVLQAIPPIVVVQTLLALPAAYLLFRGGERLFGRRAAALGTALWLTVPLWLSPIWFRSYSPPFNMAPFWLGLQISVDYATALLAIATIVLTAGGLSDGSVRRGIAIGICSGLALFAKPSNIVLVGAAVLALAVWRRRHAAIAAAATAALVTVPQLVLDWRISGRPLHTEYWSAWPYGNSKPLESLSYVPRTFGKLLLLNYTGPLLVLAFTAALVITGRRYRAARVLIVAQVVVYALVFSPLYYSISEFMLRFMTTALPALCLACGAAIVRAPVSEAVGDARPPRPPVVGLELAAAAGAAALAIFVGLAPFRPVIPVVRSLTPQLKALGRPGWVGISWRPPSAPATLTYRVDRARTPDGDEQSIWVGVRTAIRDHPPGGSWWYRVYIEPSASPDGLPAGTKFVAASPQRRFDLYTSIAIWSSMRRNTNAPSASETAQATTR
jgi:hypothetical protein